MFKCLMGATHNFEKNLIKCQWSPDATLITAGSADRTVNVWDFESGELKHRLGGHKGVVNETSIS
jgi:Prp8 binding protein